MKKLADKTALVTGSDSEIGQAIAIQFAQEGADIIIVYHTDKEGAEQTRLKVEASGLHRSTSADSSPAIAKRSG